MMRIIDVISITAQKRQIKRKVVNPSRGALNGKKYGVIMSKSIPTNINKRLIIFFGDFIISH
jgi:hypothetical protein